MGGCLFLFFTSAARSLHLFRATSKTAFKSVCLNISLYKSNGSWIWWSIGKFPIKRHVCSCLGQWLMGPPFKVRVFGGTVGSSGGCSGIHHWFASRCLNLMYISVKVGARDIHFIVQWRSSGLHARSGPNMAPSITCSGSPFQFRRNWPPNAVLPVF